jgi:hypothetical protein
MTSRPFPQVPRICREIFETPSNSPTRTSDTSSEPPIYLHPPRLTNEKKSQPRHPKTRLINLQPNLRAPVSRRSNSWKSIDLLLHILRASEAYSNRAQAFLVVQKQLAQQAAEEIPEGKEDHEIDDAPPVSHPLFIPNQFQHLSQIFSR